MGKLRKLLFYLVTLFAALAIIYLIFPAKILDTLTGEPDLGPAEFANLRPRGKPNQAFIAPEGFVSTREPDFNAPEFALSAHELRSALTEYVDSQPKIRLVASDDNALHDRFLRRSPWMAFPDTIDVKFIPLDEKRSTLAIYARAKLGIRDFGANLALIKSIIAALEANSSAK